jgi:chromosome segregation ATPase
MSELNTKQQHLLNLLEKQFKDDQYEIQDLKEKLSFIKDEKEDLEETILELESQLEDTVVPPAATLFGEQKNNILIKLRQLPLEKLQELETKYCEGISEFTQTID